MSEQRQKGRTRKVDKYPDCEFSILCSYCCVVAKGRGTWCNGKCLPPKSDRFEFEEKIKKRVRLPTNVLSQTV